MFDQDLLREIENLNSKLRSLHQVVGSGKATDEQRKEFDELFTRSLDLQKKLFAEL